LTFFASKYFFSYFVQHLKNQCCGSESFFAAPGKNFDAAPTAPVPTLLLYLASQFFENEQKLMKGLGLLFRLNFE
jgi:hypothetical protein